MQHLRHAYTQRFGHAQRARTPIRSTHPFLATHPFARFSKPHALVKLVQTKGSSAACQSQPSQGNFGQVFVLPPPSTSRPSLTVGSTRTPVNQGVRTYNVNG